MYKVVIITITNFTQDIINLFFNKKSLKRSKNKSLTDGSEAQILDGFLPKIFSSFERHGNGLALEVYKQSGVAVQDQAKGSSLLTKSNIAAPMLYDKFSEITCVDKSVKMDFSSILNKPFFSNVYSWSTTSPANSSIIVSSFPTQMLAGSLATAPFYFSSLSRVRGCFNLQVSGTSMHQGLLLAAAVPADQDAIGINQLLCAPHVFLNANEATPVCLEMPYYSPTTLMKTNSYNWDSYAINRKDSCKLVVVVLNPLATTASGSTTLTVSVHVELKEADFFVPRSNDIVWTQAGSKSFTNSLLSIPTKIFDGLAYGAKVITGDFIDTLRLGARVLTGFHNPNSTTIDHRIISGTRNFLNNVDQPTLYEKLDSHAMHDRVVRDFTFCTSQDEMDMLHVLQKPVYLGTFKVQTTTVADTNLFNYPISPFVEVEPSAFQSNLRTFYELSKYWRGSINMHIQAVMTPFHYCKLIVVKDYMCDKRSLTQSPGLNNMHNMMTETIEFSSGGQIHTINLPYCAVTEQLECTKDLAVNALQHGIARVYLVQPLTTNASVPTTVYFNVYYTVGDDFQYYGYSQDLLVSLRNSPPTPLALKSAELENATVQSKSVEQIVSSNNAKDENADSLTPIPTEAVSEVEKSIHQRNDSIRSNRVYEIADKQSGSAQTLVGVSEQIEVLNNQGEDVDENKVRVSDFMPNISVRDYIRRVTHLERQQIVLDATASNNIIIKPVSDFFNAVNGTRIAPLAVVAGRYYGVTGGLKMKVALSRVTNTVGTNVIMAQLYYVPPGTVYDPALAFPRTVDSCSNLSFISWVTNSGKSSTVCQEVPVTIQGDGTYPKSFFEFVIPNMNLQKFIRLGEASDIATPTLSDMGYIAIGFASPPNSTVFVDYYAGFTDESRLGFQIPQSSYYYDIISGKRSTMNANAVVGAPVAAKSAIAPRAYYFA